MRLGKDARFVVVGAGLIGSSLVGALRRSGATCRFVCVDRSAGTRKAAVESGLYDEAFASVGKASPAGSVVFIAVPVLAIRRVLADLAPFVDGSTVVFDGCSVKGTVRDNVRDLFGPKGARRFVLCHPIAGREFHGIGAADPTLFRDRDVVLCPQGSDLGATRAVSGIWRRAGARIKKMDVDRHDELFSVVSHLPHLLAFALVETIGADPDKRRMLEFAASGFRDFTRIASSSPRMWKDILVANRDNVLGALGDFEHALERLKDSLKSGQHEELTDSFERSKELRNRWLRRIGK